MTAPATDDTFTVVEYWVNCTAHTVDACVTVAWRSAADDWSALTLNVEPAAGVAVTCMSAALDWIGRTAHVEPASGATVQLPATVHGLVPWLTVASRSAAVEFCARTLHVEPATCETLHGAPPWKTVLLPWIWTMPPRLLRTPPASRVTSPQAVEAGTALVTTATARDESGSPIEMISWCITEELRVMDTVAALNVIVEGSAPLM